jgi:phosphatidylglycerophosphate synthase
MVKSSYMVIVDPLRNGFRVGIRRLAGLLNNLSHGKLTPNIVTTIGVVMHLPIALLIATRHVQWAALLLFVFGLFDVLDGELARLQHTASGQGMFYDATTDRIKEVLLFTGIAYNLSTGSQARWTFVAVLACGLAITVAYAKAKGEAAIALKRKITDHHVLNHYFSEGIAALEILMSIIFLGLLSDQLLAATGLIALLSAITLLGSMRTISEQL